MFGYRKHLLPVTRFYTTERIHSNMEKITEIDIALREDIESGKQGSGVYFITRKEQDCKFGNGYIRPLEDSPDTGQSHFKKVKELAIENPCIILLQEKGTNVGWNDRAFWWPVLVAPKNVSKTIYASKTIGEKVIISNESEGKEYHAI